MRSASNLSNHVCQRARKTSRQDLHECSQEAESNTAPTEAPETFHLLNHRKPGTHRKPSSSRGATRHLFAVLGRHNDSDWANAYAKPKREQIPRELCQLQVRSCKWKRSMTVLRQLLSTTILMGLVKLQHVATSYWSQLFSRQGMLPKGSFPKERYQQIKRYLPSLLPCRHSSYL